MMLQYAQWKATAINILSDVPKPSVTETETDPPGGNAVQPEVSIAIVFTLPTTAAPINATSILYQHKCVDEASPVRMTLTSSIFDKAVKLLLPLLRCVPFITNYFCATSTGKTDFVLAC